MVLTLVTFVVRFGADGQEKNPARKVWNSSQQIQGRLHKKLEVATLLYVNFLFVVFGFLLASRLVFILHIYICSSLTWEKNCHILIGCLFMNPAWV